MDYTRVVTFKATELTADITQIQPWLWGYATVGMDIDGRWVLAPFDGVEIPFMIGEYAVLENDTLVIYPAEVFQREFTAKEVRVDV